MKKLLTVILQVIFFHSVDVFMIKYFPSGKSGCTIFFSSKWCAYRIQFHTHRAGNQLVNLNHQFPWFCFLGSCPFQITAGVLHLKKMNSCQCIMLSYFVSGPSWSFWDAWIQGSWHLHQNCEGPEPLSQTAFFQSTHYSQRGLKKSEAKIPCDVFADPLISRGFSWVKMSWF